MIISRKEFDDIVDYLNKSAMYNMSLGAMELYHSNFWRWLMEYDVRYIGIFFDELDNVNKKDVEIDREFNNTDISFKVNEKYYLVENKFKSLVDKDQLERYENKFGNQFEKGKYLFPIFMQKYEDLYKGEKNIKWNFLQYEKIMKKIEDISDSVFTPSQKVTDANYKIIEEYVKMTRNLIKLIYFVIDKHYKDKYIFDDDVFKILKSIRLHDIMSKINCELLMEELKVRLENEFVEYYKILIESDYQKSAYLQARWKLPYDDNDLSKGYFLIGAHLQGDEIKTMIHMCAKQLGLEGIKNKSNDIKDKITNILYGYIEPYIFNHGVTYYSTAKTKKQRRYTGIEDGFEYLSIYKYIKITDQNNETNFDNICNEFVNILKPFENINKDELINEIKKGVKDIKSLNYI